MEKVNSPTTLHLLPALGKMPANRCYTSRLNLLGLIYGLWAVSSFVASIYVRVLQQTHQFPSVSQLNPTLQPYFLTNPTFFVVWRRKKRPSVPITSVLGQSFASFAGALTLGL